MVFERFSRQSLSLIRSQRKILTSLNAVSVTGSDNILQSGSLSA